MKNKNLMALAALLIAGVATPAFAQNYGDLIAGFSTTGTGAATNIELDLGSVNTYAHLGAGTYNIGSLGTDLSATYGAGWNSSALVFGIVGSNSTTHTPTFGSWDSQYASSTLFASEAESSPGSVATPYSEQLASQDNASIALMNGILGLSSASQGFPTGTNLADLTGTSTQAGTTLKAISIGASALGSWNNEQGNVALNIGTVTALGQTVSAAGSAVEVFTMLPDPSGNGADSADINAATSYFELLGNGDLEFVVVPEPSTYAAIVGIAVLGYALLRRRQTIAA